MHNLARNGWFPARPSPGFTTFFAGLTLVCTVGITLSPVLLADFVNRDDQEHVYATPGIWSLSRASIESAFGRVHLPRDSAGVYQPLADVSYMLDAALTGTSPARAFWFHFTNLGLHLFNTFIVFLILRRISGSVGWALLLASLFALHPAQVGTVAWVSQRGVLMGAAFFLPAILAYIRYAATGNLAWLALVEVLYAGSLMCSPIFAVLPVMLLLMDVYPLQRRGWRIWVEKIPQLGVLSAGVWLYVSIVWPHNGLTGEVNGLSADFCRNIASLMQRLLVPIGLSPLYPTPGGVTLAQVGLVVMLVAALIATSIARRSWFVAMAGALVAILPALINLPYTARLLPDWALYAAPIVPMIVIAAWLRDWTPAFPRRAIVAVAPCVVMLAAFVPTSRGLSHAWHDGGAYFARIVQTNPQWVPGYAGAVDWHLRRRDDRALEWARRAIAAAPDDPLASYCLGTALLQQPEGASEAIGPLRDALSQRPDWAECLQNLGAALSRIDAHDEAVSCLERARDLRPESSNIRIGLGYAYLDIDRPSSARGEFQIALRRNNSPIVHLGLAMAWAEMDENDLARRHLWTAIERDRRYVRRATELPLLRRLMASSEFDGFDRTPARWPATDPAPWDMPIAGTGHL